MRVPEATPAVKPPWGRGATSNEFGGQWDPEDDADSGGGGGGSSAWNAPPPSVGAPSQWSGAGAAGIVGGGGGGGQSSSMWPPGKDVAKPLGPGGVDWSNPGSGTSSTPWGQPPQQQGPAVGASRWGSAPGGPKPPMPPVAMSGAAPWGGKAGWGDENSPPVGSKNADDGTALWGAANGTIENKS